MKAGRLARRSATQAAILTPLGQGGIAVVQIVGPRAHELAWQVFRPARPAALPIGSQRLLYGHIVDEAGVIDEVLVRFVAPAASRHGEPTVEVNCHGGLVAVQRVLECLVERGAEPVDGQRLVERAARDRIEAEAALALLCAATPLAADTLLDQLDGALGRALRSVPWERPETASACLRALLATERLGRALWQPPTVALVGPTNAGKSTLFNALAREDRVIVSPTPGTTRDAVRAEVAIGGIAVWLVDTAGEREVDSLVDREAIARARQAAATAALALLVLDACAPLPTSLAQLREALPCPALVVLNKADLPRAPWAREAGDAQAVSAARGHGLAELSGRIVAELVGEARYQEGRPVVFTERQGALLRAALGHLEAGRPGEARDLVGECIAPGGPPPR